MENQMKITTLPVIEYSVLDKIALEVKEDLAKLDIKAIAPTEDSVTFLKKFRAEKNKQFKEFEDARKEIKKAVNDPYDKFNKAYEEKIAKQFKELDVYLVDAISKVENGLKEAREMELVAYFSSLLTEEISFLTFSQMNLKINLSDSMKSLKTEVEKFVTKALDDYNLIMTQPNAERILVRYKAILNVSQAITSVKNEIEQEEALAKLKAVKIEEPIEPKTFLDEEPKPIEPSEPILKSTFTVKGTKAQLIALKQYINNSGLTLE